MDLVLLGGNVLTMDGLGRRAEALAVKDGKIVAVGASEQLARMAGPETRIVHMAGRTLVPGFIDPHNHFGMTTFDPVSVDCSTPPLRDLAGVLEAILAAARDAPRGRWIWGWGVSRRVVIEGRGPNRWELDEAAPDNPVCVMDSSYHCCYVNSSGLRLAGIDRNTPDPSHGQILKDEKGEPNGTLWERAMDLAHTLTLGAYLDYYREDLAELVHQNCMRHLSLGITGVGDALVMPEGEQIYHLADAHKKLPIALHQLRGGEQFFAVPRRVTRGKASDGNVSDRLRGGTVKIFMDPVFPQIALTRFHPGGCVEHVGERYYTQEEIDALVMEGHKAGLQIAIHCIGTWAIEQALNAFEKAQRERPRPEPRLRIEHFCLPTLEQIRRAVSLGVIASAQPAFISTYADAEERLVEGMGKEILIEPLGSMVSEGLTVAAGSDCPCAPLSPMYGIYSMVTRRARSDGHVIAPEQAVTALDGLRMYTIGSARAMSRDGEVGSLEVGKRADMALLSHDPATSNPEFIRDIVVEQTYVDGKLLYHR